MIFNRLPATAGSQKTAFASLIALCVLFASSTGHAEDNPYTSNYQAQNATLHSLQAASEPQMFVGNKRDEDNLSMLENGYDLMGMSSFEYGEVAPEQALAHARSIQADRVLVYVKKGGNQTPSMTMEVIKEAVKKGKQLTEQDVAPQPNKYRYFASFWAKLPPPVLGIHVIKLVPKKDLEADEKAEAKFESEGVAVIAVIHDSAAEKAGLFRNDQLISINKDKVSDAASLSKLVQRYRGKAVTLNIRRAGVPIALEAQL